MHTIHADRKAHRQVARRVAVTFLLLYLSFGVFATVVYHVWLLHKPVLKEVIITIIVWPIIMLALLMVVLVILIESKRKDSW